MSKSTRQGPLADTAASGEDLAIAVTYTGFSDDGERVLDGTEYIVNAGGPTGSVEYEADIRVSGGHEGYLRASGVQGNAATGFTGRIESSVDGASSVLDLDAAR